MLAFEAMGNCERGFRARRLEDGYPEWNAAGLPVVVGPEALADRGKAAFARGRCQRVFFPALQRHGQIAIAAMPSAIAPSRRVPPLRTAGDWLTAGPYLLNWRARHLTKRTEHAAIPGLRFHHRLALAAFVEKLAGIRRHRFGSAMPADRAGNRRNQFHREHGAPQLLGAEG